MNNKDEQPNKAHDRLDLKLTTREFTDTPCGSLNRLTSKPEYCDFECPTLKAS